MTAGVGAPGRGNHSCQGEGFGEERLGQEGEQGSRKAGSRKGSALKGGQAGLSKEEVEERERAGGESHSDSRHNSNTEKVTLEHKTHCLTRTQDECFYGLAMGQKCKVGSRAEAKSLSGSSPERE